MILEEIREWHTVNTVYDGKAFYTCWMCDKGGLIHFKDLRLGKRPNLLPHGNFAFICFSDQFVVRQEFAVRALYQFSHLFFGFQLTTVAPRAPSAPPTAQRRCALLGRLVRRAGGILDHPHWPDARLRWASVGTPCASGSNWASRPPRAWAGSETRPGASTRPASPATGWCFGGNFAGSGLRRQGGGRQ